MKPFDLNASETASVTGARDIKTDSFTCANTWILIDVHWRNELNPIIALQNKFHFTQLVRKPTNIYFPAQHAAV